MNPYDCLAYASVPMIVGPHPHPDSEVARDVRKATGTQAHLEAGSNRFDILPLLVATDGALAAFGEDTRRFRQNLVIGGVEGLGEREWEAVSSPPQPARVLR